MIDNEYYYIERHYEYYSILSRKCDKIFICEILCAECFLCRSPKIRYNIPWIVFQVGFWFIAELVFCAGARLLTPRGTKKVLLKWSLRTVCRHSNMLACSIHAVGWVPDRRRGWERRDYSIAMADCLSPPNMADLAYKSALYGGHVWLALNIEHLIFGRCDKDTLNNSLELSISFLIQPKYYLILYIGTYSLTRAFHRYFIFRLYF